MTKIKSLFMAPLLGLLAVVLVFALVLLLLFVRPHTAKAITGPPPTCTAPAATPGAPGGDGSYAGISLSPSQMDVAQSILGTAKGMTITRRGATIALQTAMQESRLNADAVSGRATGAFQQIAPGPFDAYVGYDPHDAAASAKGFFTVLLKRVPDYDTNTQTNHDIAQEVQHSGAGAAKYTPWQPFAEAVTGALYDGSGPPLDCADRSVRGPIHVEIRGNEVTLPPQAGVSGVIRAASPRVAKAIGSGLAWLGTPYAWGGGNINGPTKGISDNGGEADHHGDFNKVGFDCSGLTLYSYGQAGVMLTRPARTQLINAKLAVPFSQGQPGDLLFWGTHHVAIYLGQVNGRHIMLESPQSGDIVKVSTVRVGGDFRNVAARPIPGGM
jgi:cell wall-associated NlpC family hydrolase